jgi:hypothetical protein
MALFMVPHSISQYIFSYIPLQRSGSTLEGGKINGKVKGIIYSF